MGKQSGLRISRLIELLLRVVKGKLRNIVSKNVAGLCVDFPGNSIFVTEIATHTLILRPLPGEDVQNVFFAGKHSSRIRDVQVGEE